MLQAVQGIDTLWAPPQARLVDACKYDGVILNALLSNQRVR